MAHVFIIAEAGVNHNGSLEIAKRMVDEAKEAGADCIKFQTFISANLTSKNADKAEYQKSCADASETQLDMLKKLELPFSDFVELDTYCKERNIEFLSTAFDSESISFLSTLGMKRWKIPSSDLTNLPYLIQIGQKGKPIILSTGMSTMEEVHAAVAALKNSGSPDITLLHCTTEYPAPYEEVNLKAMQTILTEFCLPVGYSDHTNGIAIPIAAVAMGASVIEKHFTLSCQMEGPDHRASLEPGELKAMISAIRHVETALGDGIKKPTASEIKNTIVARKSIIAKRNILKGETYSEDNLTVKRPGSGICPMKWFDVIGRNAPRDFQEDELIEL